MQKRAFYHLAKPPSGPPRLPPLHPLGFYLPEFVDDIGSWCSSSNSCSSGNGSHRSSGGGNSSNSSGSSCGISSRRGSGNRGVSGEDLQSQESWRLSHHLHSGSSHYTHIHWALPGAPRSLHSQRRNQHTTTVHIASHLSPRVVPLPETLISS